MHERYGHVQEIIVQPVVENERWRDGTPSLETLRRVTAMARALPSWMNGRMAAKLA